MNELIAVVPMKVSQEEEQMEGDLSFQVERSDKATVNAQSADEKPTYEEATQELNALIGLEAVKKQIDEFAAEPRPWHKMPL